MKEEILAGIRKALAAIAAPRFYESERGFQGQLLIELERRFALPKQAILEQEYQKTAQNHGLKCRPDIILHEPFDPERHKNRAEGNFAVIELKLRATPKTAAEDYSSLRDMIRVLNYPLGIFVNIDAENTFGDLIPEDVAGQIVSIAVSLRDGSVRIIEKAI